jgi:hypothetical protein
MSPARTVLAALALLALTLGSAPARSEDAAGYWIAPGTGASCASWCAQRWRASPEQVRACSTRCWSLTLSATAYFSGQMREDDRCRQILVVNPNAKDGNCGAFGSRPDGSIAAPTHY